MRKVWIINTCDMKPHEIEEKVNAFFQKVHDDGGHIEKTQYSVDKLCGELTMVIVEYETKE